jgi:hypothetical protein
VIDFGECTEGQWIWRREVIFTARCKRNRTSYEVSKPCFINIKVKSFYSLITIDNTPESNLKGLVPKPFRSLFTVSLGEMSFWSSYPFICWRLVSFRLLGTPQRNRAPAGSCLMRRRFSPLSLKRADISSSAAYPYPLQSFHALILWMGPVLNPEIGYAYTPTATSMLVCKTISRSDPFKAFFCKFFFSVLQVDVRALLYNKTEYSIQ